MDLVYVCRDGDNEELRYSIRSAVANLKHDNIWVVGGKPEWYTGNYIEVKQKSSKYENVRASLYAIVESSEISDDFILMNDDFFILSKIDRLNAYYGGSLRDRIKELQSRYGSSSYTILLKSTLKYLMKNGIPNPKNYALHIPFKLNKKKLKPILKLDVSWRTAYGNLYKIAGIDVSSDSNVSGDVKVFFRKGRESDYSKNKLSKRFLSSQDDSFEIVLPKLQKMFPIASAHEKTD